MLSGVFETLIFSEAGGRGLNTHDSQLTGGEDLVISDMYLVTKLGAGAGVKFLAISPN